MKNWKQIAAWKNASMQPSLGIKRYPATTRHATTTMTWLVLTSLLILCCYCLRQSILWPRAWQQRNVNDLDYQYLDVMGATLGVQFGWWRSEPDTKFGWWRSEPDTTAATTPSAPPSLPSVTTTTSFAECTTTTTSSAECTTGAAAASSMPKFSGASLTGKKEDNQ